MNDIGEWIYLAGFFLDNFVGGKFGLVYCHLCTIIIISFKAKMICIFYIRE